MATDYTPSSPEIERLFRRYKQALTTERELRPEVKEAAETELRGGATVRQLAAATGMTPEVFRKIARDIGVERKRPPTVGPLRKKGDAGGTAE